MAKSIYKSILKLLPLIGLFAFRSEQKAPAEVIKRLDELGYFKYVDSTKIAELKSEISQSFNAYNILSTVSDDETLLPFDYRLYVCDGEALFEVGGMEEYLAYARHAFEKRGLQLEWTDEISEVNGTYWNHRITVNGKVYVAFEGKMDGNEVWGIAQLNFYRMLNDQLAIQGSNERVYPISGGEEGQFVFLTEELYAYISATFYQGKDFRKWDLPYPVEKWSDVNGLN